MKFPKPMDVERAERPLRIAVVYSRIPLPMRRADQLTVAHLLSFLKARGHAVDLYCVNTGGVADEADLAWLHEDHLHKVGARIHCNDGLTNDRVNTR